MKFDIDCAREILLTLEAKEDDFAIGFIELNNSLPTYSGKPSVVQYACLKLEELGYIKLNKKFVGNRYIDIIESVSGITATGHMYLSELLDSAELISKNSEHDKKTPKKENLNKTFKTITKVIAFLASLVGLFWTCAEIFDRFFT